MVPDLPSLSRRQFLGGLAGVAAGGTVAVGAKKPTALPDALTDQATKVYPTPPELNALWRPTVTEAHAAEAVSLLADTVSRGERLWDRLETDEHFLGAGGWLESAREDLRKGNYPEALFDATYGMQFAGEDLGFARAELGEATLRALAERGDELLARVRRVSDDVRPYPVVEPARDLAWYYRIERELLFGRRHATWDGVESARDGVDDEDGPNTSEYDAHDVGTITSGLLQAEIYVRNAERYRDLLAERVGDSGTRYADHLRSVADEFQGSIDDFPTRDEVRSRFVDEDDETYGPYEFAHSRLAMWCFDSLVFGGDESDDLLAYRAVELSKGLAQRRAHAVAVDRLAVEEGDEGFDSGHALAEKRRARSVYRSVVGSDPPPLLTVQVTRAVEDLQVAKVGFAGHTQRPLWRERLKAYLYALVGRAKLQQYPAVYGAIVDRN